MPTLKFSIWLCLIAPALIASPLVTNSGSASVTCQWVGEGVPTEGVYKTYGSSGDSINLSCPASDPLYQGPAVSGSAGNISASVNQAGAYLGRSSFDFESSAADTMTFPGSGIAQVVITLDFTVGAGNDETAFEQATADFWLNGSELWSAEKKGLNFEFPLFTTRQIVLTELITLGVPFSYQANVKVTGGGNGDGYARSALVIDSITDPVVTVPEPSSLLLFMIGLVGLWCIGLWCVSRAPVNARVEERTHHPVIRLCVETSERVRSTIATFRASRGKRQITRLTVHKESMIHS